MAKFLLIDGSSLIHRAFYALPLLTTKQGQFTNGVYGFAMMLNRMIKEQQPDYLLVCFDKSRVTFRTEIAADYKGTRAETPNELRGQFELVKEYLDALAVAWIELDRYEADDLLGTFAKEGKAAGFDCVIFSGDKDVLQLIEPQVGICLTKKGITEIECWDSTRVMEKYGLTPKQLIDLKSLMGDASDHISGVPGVGEKTALKLLAQFHDLDSLYEQIEQVENEKLRQKLIDNKDLAYQSKALATICRDIPLEINWAQYAMRERDGEQYLEICKRLEFKSLVKEAETMVQKKAPVAVPFQEDLPWAVASSALLSAEGSPSIGDVMGQIKKKGKFTFHLQWQGVVVEGKITDCGIALPDGQYYCLDLKDINTFAELFADPQIAKRTANAKESIMLLAKHGIQIKNLCGDVMIAAYLLQPSESEYVLDDLARQYEVKELPLVQTQDCAYYALLTDRLSYILEEKIASCGMDRLYHTVEMPLCAVLAVMELSGVKVDRQKLRQMSKDLQEHLDQLVKEIYQLAGHEFNLNSPKQLGYVLFEEMQIPAVKKTKTGYSTDSEVLEQLAKDFEIAAKLLDYRAYAKLKSTYTDSLDKLINPQTGKVHTTFKQTVTTTGRLSSVEPNLQNIPIRMELGKKLRQVFVAENENHLLLAADYNQIELRVLAHISQEPKLIQAFLDGEDIHTRTASEVLGVAPSDITSDMRRQAKAVNFGIVYGISDYGLSRNLGISRRQAQDYIDLYFERYPGVLRYQKESIKSGEELGYVSTLLGRRRYLPDLRSSNFNLRSFAQRMAINTPIQGTAADIIKIAMVNIYKQMLKQNLRSKMILQVHDELIFDVPFEEKDTMEHLVQEKMQNALELVVPLTVDLKTGFDWYNMKPSDFNSALVL